MVNDQECVYSNNYLMQSVLTTLFKAFHVSLISDRFICIFIYRMIWILQCQKINEPR